MDTKWILVLVFAILYGLFEYYLNVRQKSNINIIKTSDKKSLQFLLVFLQIGNILSFSIGATKIGRIDNWMPFIIFGVLLVLIGIVVRINSIMTLKQHYTYTVTKTVNHELIETGLYKYIRHPGYLGFLIVFFGISTALANWLSIILMMVPVMVGIMNRIRIEEKFLIEQMGDKYLTYQKRTKRLIPNIY